MTRRVLASSVAAAVATLVVGLGAGYLWGHAAVSDGASSPDATSLGTLQARASATGHDAADVAFAAQMVPHHQQAVTMAKLAATRAGSGSVRALASTIEQAQGPEIATMRRWLAAWGGTSTSTGDVDGMHMSDGMMSRSDMQRLATLRGSAFDKEWLTMMIGHHQGAVEMARTELAHGRNADALALAASIELTQQAQIDQMRGLIAG